MRSLFAAALAALALTGGASLAEAATGSALRAGGAYEGKSRPDVRLARGTFDDEGDVLPMGHSRTGGHSWKRSRHVRQDASARAAAQAVAGGSGSTGMASYYGGQFHGRRTASGARFDAGGLTAAHRSLPFGTRVRVTHMGNGRSVVVRINDRGPYVGGRIIDLSSGAAGVIGMHGQGVARVRVTVLGR
jgi:rare lipoprotein A (peptidoglycan hydrolase)